MDRELLLSNFREFVGRNSYLNDVVLNKKATWQELYELWYMNGENSSVWDTYKNVNKEPISEAGNPAAALGSFTMNDLFSALKKIDLHTLESNLKNIEKAVGVLQTFVSSDKEKPKDIYQQRPLYRRFED